MPGGTHSSPAGPHHACALRHSFPALTQGRAQGASHCPWATWHQESQAGAARSSPHPGTAPWLCRARLCSAPHSSPIFSGTWALQCHAQPGQSPTCLLCRLLSLPEVSLGAAFLAQAPDACKGSQSHHELAGAPGFNSCHAAAHQPAEQPGRPGCTFSPVPVPAQSHAHPVPPATAMGLSQL